MTQVRLHLTARKPEVHHIASILDPQFEEDGVTSVLFEADENSGQWCYSIYVDQKDVDFWTRTLKERLGDDLFGLTLEQEVLEDINWVTHTLKNLPPVSAGRFLVHGSHDRHLAKNARIPIEIDAGQAFGTGHHGTTAGCLDVLEHCLRQSSGQLGQPRRAMDIGTGSGLLAIALAKALHIPVLATDIDPISVEVAHVNAQINGVAPHVTCVHATGFNHRAFNAFGKADLIFANILARPLEALARPMRAHVNPGGQIILSGLLPHQKARITAAFARQNMILEKWHIRDGWLTLLMRGHSPYIWTKK